MLKDLNIDLEKNGFTEFPYSGNYFYIESSNGEVVLELLGDDTNSNAVVTANEGALFEGINYNAFKVKNAFNGVNNLKVVYGFGKYQATGTKIVGTIATEQASAFGITYQTLELNGIEKQVLDYDIGRLSVRLHNLSDEPIKIGQSDVSQTFYELQADEILTLAKAPILAVWVIGTGRLSVVCEYKEQQAVIEAEPLADENGVLTDDNDNTLDTY